METKKKMSIGLAMAIIMVAAVFAPLALAQGPDDVQYVVNVLAVPQLTYFCCEPNGDFGTMVRGETSIIEGTFGLENEGEVKAKVCAKFITPDIPCGAPVGMVWNNDYTNCSAEVIAATNFALRKSGNGTKKLACCTTVDEGDADIGTGLIAFDDSVETHAENVAGDNVYNCGEWIYKAKGEGDPTTVEAGDTRLTEVKTANNFYSCGSVVADGDEDIGVTLVAFTATERHADDGPTPNAYDCYESIYNDLGISYEVDPGDHRLTFVMAPCNCVIEGACSLPGGWTPLDDNGANVPLGGFVPPDPDHTLCCCYDASLFVPPATTPGPYSGIVQLTFVNAGVVCP